MTWCWEGARPWTPTLGSGWKLSMAYPKEKDLSDFGGSVYPIWLDLLNESLFTIVRKVSSSKRLAM
jgi:hypothetical protein